MSWWVVAKVWRLPVALGTVIVALVLCTTSAQQVMPIPLADGPRSIRQGVAAILPVMLGVSLVDAVPSVTATARRSRLLSSSIKLILVAAAATALAPSWTSIRLPIAAFDLFVLLSLFALVLHTVPRWGVHGVLAASVISLGYLLFYGLICDILGFAPYSEMLDESVPFGFYTPMAPRAWGFLAAALAATVAGIFTQHPPQEE